MVHTMHFTFNHSGFLVRNWRNEALHFNKAAWLGSAVVAVVVFRQTLFTLSSASQNSPSSFRSFPGDNSKTPCRQLSGAALSGFFSLPRLSTSLFSLCHPNVSATSCKSQLLHLRDERTIHYSITTSSLHKGSQFHFPSLHMHVN